MFSWGESRDETTGESLIVFALAPEEVMRWAQADAAGDVAAAKALERELPKEPWIYALGLRGKAKVYRKGTIELFEPRPCGSSLQLDSGLVEVDRKKGTVHIALKVAQDGKIIDFVGNGDYPLEKKPNKSATDQRP